MKTMIERVMAGETVTVGKVAAGTTVTQGMIDQMYEAVGANQSVNFVDLEVNSYREVTGAHRLEEMNLRELAQSYLDREDEDWTFSDPEDIKRLARAVLSK